jgi:hypothetical protein
MASDPLQYYIGRGTLEVKIGVGAWRDVGNVPVFELTPTIEKLEHRSSRTGIRSTDRSVVVEKGGTVRIVLEEYNYDLLSIQNHWRKVLIEDQFFPLSFFLLSNVLELFFQYYYN